MPDRLSDKNRPLQGPGIGPAGKFGKMEKRLFTVIAVPADLALGWARGQIEDWLLLLAHCPALPAPALVILRVDGRAAGMRALFAWLRAFARGHEIAGFAMRTRLAGVERVFQRFGGTVSFDEGDGDRRWWAPPGPGVAWLTATS
jgi:hypothetical protein